MSALSANRSVLALLVFSPTPARSTTPSARGCASKRFLATRSTIPVCVKNLLTHAITPSSRAPHRNSTSSSISTGKTPSAPHSGADERRRLCFLELTVSAPTPSRVSRASVFADGSFGKIPHPRLETVANDILRLPFASGKGLRQTCKHPAAVFSVSAPRVAALSIVCFSVAVFFFGETFGVRERGADTNDRAWEARVGHADVLQTSCA